MKVKIIFSDREVEAELYDSDLTIIKLKPELPFGNRAHVTEGEVYVSLPIVGEPGEETSDVEVGDICFWEEANALLFILGRTKQSTDENPRTIDSVTKVGRITGNINILKKVKYRDKLVVKIE